MEDKVLVRVRASMSGLAFDFKIPYDIQVKDITPTMKQMFCKVSEHRRARSAHPPEFPGVYPRAGRGAAGNAADFPTDWHGGRAGDEERRFADSGLITYFGSKQENGKHAGEQHSNSTKTTKEGLNMSKVTVNTQGLRQKASTISSEAAAYQKEMQKMFEAVESLKSSCEGTDINAYVKDIVNCKPEMEALYNKLSASAQTLEGIAEIHDKVEASYQ